MYLNHTSDRFIMYGNGTKILGYRIKPWTTDHLTADGSAPDFIYIRPKWYLSYVENLASLLAMKYSLNKNSLNINIFQKMVDFAKTKQCSLKGIIDYEIAKKRNKKEIDIPVYYSTDQHLIASLDAVIWTNYVSIAKITLDNTVKYLNEVENIHNFQIQEIKSKIPSINRGGVFDTLAFKIILK